MQYDIIQSFGKMVLESSVSKAIFFALGLFFMLSLAGCQLIGNQAEEEDFPKPFFDLKAFVKEETAALAEQNGFEKTVYLNGKEETQSLETLDFSRELEVFEESDINKKSWLDKYSIDSLINASGQLEGLSYQAQDEKLRTRQIDIAFKDGEVKKLDIHNRTESLVFENEQWLKFEADRGYRIETMQKRVFADQRDLLVEVKF